MQYFIRTVILESLLENYCQSTLAMPLDIHIKGNKFFSFSTHHFMAFQEKTEKLKDLDIVLCHFDVKDFIKKIPKAKSKKHDFVKLTKFDNKWILSHGDIQQVLSNKVSDTRNSILINKVIELTEDTKFELPMDKFNTNLLNIISKTMKPFNKEQPFNISKNEINNLKVIMETDNVLFTQVIAYTIK